MCFLRAHATTELDSQELIDQHVAVHTATDLDLQLRSNVKFGTVHKLFPHGSNTQESICVHQVWNALTHLIHCSLKPLCLKI
jgi:hypothetical protein